MTDKELKHLSRMELIDIIYELHKQNEQNAAQIEKLQAALDEKELHIENAGSIAEAAVQISGVLEAAQAAAELASREVVVIPTKTVPQGISAMLSFDAAMEPSENEAAMTDCLSGVMTMQITYAARDSDFDGFDIHAGDYLGLCDGALAGTTREITTLLASLADKAAEAGKEFINIFYGADIQEPDAEAALELFRQHAPDAEVNLVSGGQPIYYYLISAE